MMGLPSLSSSDMLSAATGGTFNFSSGGNSGGKNTTSPLTLVIVGAVILGVVGLAAWLFIRKH